MAKKLLLLSIFLIGGCGGLFSQNISEFIRSKNVNIQNTVYIKQVGYRNSISSRTKALESDLGYLQYGFGNSIYFSSEAAKISSVINQEGTNNSFLSSSFNEEAILNTQVNQQGNNLQIESFGINKIANQMKLNMTGNYRTVIIRNFQ